MNTVMVGYNLSGTARSYEDFTTALHDLGDWWHHLNNTWLIRTERSPAEIRDALKPLIADTDEILVLDVTGAGAAWSGFDDNGSQWLKDKL